MSQNHVCLRLRFQLVAEYSTTSMPIAVRWPLKRRSDGPVMLDCGERLPKAHPGTFKHAEMLRKTLCMGIT